jgi:type II secretory pathway component PulF
MPEALLLAGEATGSRRVIQASREASGRVEGGGALAAAGVVEGGLYPSGFRPLLDWGESNRALPEVLRLVADMLTTRARTHARFLGIFLYVLICVLVVMGVLLLLLSIYQPVAAMIQLLNALM